MPFNSRRFVKALLGWIAVSVAMAVVTVVARYYPPLWPVAIAMVLGVIIGMVAWLGVLAWRGYEVKILTPGRVVFAACVYILRDIVLKIAMGSPLSVIVGAVGLLLYASLSTRKLINRPA